MQLPDMNKIKKKLSHATAVGNKQKQTEDFAWDNIFFFCPCRVIALAYYFGKMAPVTAIIDAISL